MELTYKFEKNCLGYEVEVKFPSMRKAQAFCIYNVTAEDKYIFLQAEKHCARIEIATGNTIFTNKGSCPMNYYLMFKRTGEFVVPMQFVQDILNVLKSDTRVQADGGIMVFGQGATV